MFHIHAAPSNHLTDQVDPARRQIRTAQIGEQYAALVGVQWPPEGAPFHAKVLGDGLHGVAVVQREKCVGLVEFAYERVHGEQQVLRVLVVGRLRVAVQVVALRTKQHQV